MIAMKILTEMKRIIIASCLVLAAIFANAQSWNPYVNQAITDPAPLLPWEFGGTGVLSFNVGNSGSDPLPLVVNQEMGLVITLSSGVPNNTDPLEALGGTWLNYFNWTYDAGNKTFTGIQNKPIPGTTPAVPAVGTITIQYKVTVNTSGLQPSNGFNVNVQPPDYTNGKQATDDDAASSYTYVKALDFGDAPESYGIAYHEIYLFKDPGNTYYTNYVYLGASVDPEPANQPSGNADGDDNNGSDDEDGVVFPELTPGATVTIPVTMTIIDGDVTYSTYRLNAWIDWNGDGNFDTGERIANNISIDYFVLGGISGTYNLSVTVPANATTSPTYARFRFGSGLTSPFNDPAATSIPVGEVEDYMIVIGCTPPPAPIVGVITQPSCATPTGSVVLSGLPSTGSWIITRSPGGTTYTGSGTSFTVTGLPPATTYTFTVTSSEGCPSPSSENVVINAAPTVPILGGDSDVCAGQTTTVTPGTGGTWTSSNTSIATVTNAGVVTGVSAGVVTLTYTRTSDGCSNTMNFTVYATPSAPTGMLAITNSTCTNCTLSGGSIALGTVTGTGGTLQFSTDGGVSWSTSLPVYDQDGPAQMIHASVLSADGCRSAMTLVGTTAPGTCTTPSAPTGTLDITNSTCANCTVSGGTIALGSVTGSGGTLQFSTDGGTTWSSSLPVYNQTGPVQLIYASVLSADGCRSNIVLVGSTSPGTCTTPAAPTGTLAIINSTCTDCVVSGGSIALGTLNGSGGTLQFSTDGGATWSATLPVYDQDGPAQTIHASVLSANGCRSVMILAGTTAPGVCTPANAGSDQAVDCYSTGTATMSATGTGTWSLGAGSAGTVTITNPSSPTTTVTSFSAPGTYNLVWTTTNGCTDIAVITAGTDCGCPITGNTITQPTPAGSCAPYGGTTIFGSAPSPGGGTYLWEVNSGSGFIPAPGINNQQNYTTGALTAGTYTYRRQYTTTSGVICSTYSNSVTITVYATPAAPTGTLTIVNSSCTNCMLSGGSISLGTVSGSGGTLQFSTDGGSTWSSSLPVYDQDGPAQTIHASVVSPNGCRSPMTLVGTTAPGTCTTPAPPTGALDITNSSCTNCTLSGGTITLGTVTGTGGTLQFSTDGGTTWSATLPVYDQDGPVQIIYASVVSPNGCRSDIVLVGSTSPGACTTPSAPSGTLAIVNSTCINCVVSGGSIGLGTVTGTGGTLQFSTDGGTTWSATLPVYDQDGPAQTIYASILSANGCRSVMILVGTTAPGVCTPANAGSDQTVDCYITGTATMSATGTGTWSLGAGSAGTATITNPSSPTTTVTSFSAPGTYNLVWTTTNGCTDIAVITANNNCDCPVTNNIITEPSPASGCAPFAGTTIMGAAASPGGGTYLWEVNSGSGFTAAPGTNNQQNYTTGTLTAGTYTYRRQYTTTSGVICSTYSNSVTITVYATPAPPTGALAITNSSCVDCTVSGGSIALGSVTGSGGTLQFSTDGGATWSATLPSYDQDGPAQTIYASVLSPNGCRSVMSLVGTTSPGSCTTPATPTGTLAIINSTCTNCTVGGGTIALGTLSGSGGTLQFSTDGGATWSATLPSYNQEGPAQTIHASVLSPNGCRSTMILAGTTFPGSCTTPATPTGTLAIINSTCTNCTVGGGTIGLGTLSGTGGTLQFSTDGGATWSATLPSYNQEGPAQTIHASVLSADGCRSVMILAGTTAPGVCMPANAGPDQSVDCYSTGTATMSATGTGTWSLGAGSAGTATIANPASPTTTVTGFSVPGTYNLIWTTTNGCMDVAVITAGTDCTCPITNNTITQPSPAGGCAPFAGTTIMGAAASPGGGTYLWEVSTGNGFIPAPGTNNQQNYTTGTLNAGTYTYRRQYTTVTGVICTTTSNSVNIIVNAAPAAPAGTLAITNSSCTDCTVSGGSIALGSVTGIGGTLQFSTDGGATWSLTLPAYDQDGPAQTIHASVLSADGCRSAMTLVGTTAPGSCTTSEAPTGTLTITNSTCSNCTVSGGSIALGSVTGIGGTLQFSTDGGATWSATLPVYDQDGPAQTIHASVLSADGCRSAMILAGTTAPGICVPANAGSDQTVDCYSTGRATMSATGTGTWSLGAGSAGTATIANPSSPTTTVTGFSAPGTYNLVWTTTNGCTDIVVITAGTDCTCPITNNTISEPSPASGCAPFAGTTIMGAAASPGGGTYLWEVSTGGAFTPAPGTNNQQNYTTGTLNAGTYTYRRQYTTTSGVVCTTTSNSVTVTVYATPATPTVSVTQPSCETNSGVITVTTPVGAGYQYSINGIVYQSGNRFTGVAPGTYQVTVKNEYGCISKPRQVTITLSGCGADLAIEKTVNAEIPYFGTDLTFTIRVTNNGPDNATNIVVTDILPSGYTFLSATPSRGTWDAPTWTLAYLRAGASETLKINARVNSTGTYVNTASVTGSSEDPVPGNNSDSAETDPVAPSLIIVNEHLVMCGESTLTGNILANGDRDYLGSTLTVNTTPVASPVHGVVVIAADGSFTYTPESGFSGIDRAVFQVCSPLTCKYDTLFVTVYTDITVDAGEDQDVCGVTSLQLTGTAYPGAVSAWTRISGPNVPVFSAPSAATTTVSGLIRGSYLFLYSHQLAGCYGEDTVRVTVHDPPKASAGPDAVMCSGNDYKVTGSSASDYASVTWTHNGMGTLEDANSLHPVYHSPAGESGDVVLTMHVTPFGGEGCSDVWDSMVITILPKPEIQCPEETDFVFKASPGLCGYVIPNKELDALGAFSFMCDQIMVRHDFETWGNPQTLEGAFFPVGTTVVEWWAEACGPSCNSDTCRISVTVVDEEPPVFVNCPYGDVFVVGLYPGACETGAVWSIPVARDNCSGVEVTQVDGPSLGTQLTAGQYTIRYKAEDASGNIAFCAFILKVVDTEYPFMVCQPDIYMDNDPGLCGWKSPPHSLSPLLANSNCSFGITWEVINPDGTRATGVDDVSGYTFLTGTSTVKYILRETAGSQADSCAFTVTIRDREAPALLCGAPVTYKPGAGECYADIIPAPPAYTENCNRPVTLSYKVWAPDNSVSGPFKVSALPYRFMAGISQIIWTVTDESGNSAVCMQQVNVIVDNSTIKPFAGENASICEGSTFTSGDASAPAGLELEWRSSGTGTFSDPAALRPVYTPSPADILNGSVILILTASSECASASDFLILTITGYPEVYAGEDFSACDGDIIHFDTATAVNAAPLIWTTTGAGTLSDNTALHPVYTPGEGEFGVIRFVLTGHGQEGCTGVIVSDTLFLTIHEPLLVDAGEDRIILRNRSVNLMATVENGSGNFFYNWEPATKVYNHNTSSTETQPLNADTRFILTVTDGVSGCVGRDTVDVAVKDDIDDVLIIYNAISPNKDGINDVWLIDGIDLFPDNEVMIFNRWGDKIIEFQGYGKNEVLWDGTNSHGKPVPDGTYYYLLKIHNEKTYTGWIQVKSSY